MGVQQPAFAARSVSWSWSNFFKSDQRRPPDLLIDQKLRYLLEQRRRMDSSEKRKWRH
jgi:hypothetical protein